MRLIRAGLSETEADAHLDRLRATFAAAHLEDQEALKSIERELAEVRRQLAEVKQSQWTSPGRIETIITTIITTLASSALYDVLKSRFESGSLDTANPTAGASLPSGGYKPPDADSYKVHLLIVSARDQRPIEDAFIAINVGRVNLRNRITHTSERLQILFPGGVIDVFRLPFTQEKTEALHLRSA